MEEAKPKKNKKKDPGREHKKNWQEVTATAEVTKGKSGLRPSEK